MKKHLLIFTILFFSIAGKAQVLTEGYITYSILDNSYANVMLYDAAGGTDVVIPDFVTDPASGTSYPVKSIGNGVFVGKNLTSIVMPNSIEVINAAAFTSNNLTSITLPENLITISYSVFENNQLTSITLPEHVESLDWKAFKDNPITTIICKNPTPPTVVTGGPNDSFNINRSGIDLQVPVGAIAAYSTDPGAMWTGFSSVTEFVETVNVGDTFTDNYIMYEVTSTTDNTIKALYYDVAGGSTATVPEQIDYNGQSLTVNEIGEYCFEEKGMTNITIPNTIETIGAGAFFGNELTSFTLPDGITTIPHYALQRNELTSIVIPNTVTSIGSQALAENQLTSIMIPNTVTELGSSAFRNNQLTSINIPSSISVINHNTFENNQLASITFPATITEIGGSAFANNLLTTVTIPEQVETLGNASFARNQITDATLNEALTLMGPNVFEDNQLTTITIPENVETMGGKIFRNNPLTEVISKATTPPTINTTGDFLDTFNENRSGISLTIPEGTMGSYVTDAGALWTGFGSVMEETSVSTTDENLVDEITIITTIDKIEIITKDAKLSGYRLFDLTGGLASQGTENEIVTHGFIRGLYLLQLHTDKGTIIEKVFVK